MTEPTLDPCRTPCDPPCDLDTSCCPDWDDYDDAVKDRSTALAWSSIRVLTAGQVGACPVTVRPCRSRCKDGAFYVAPSSRGGGGWMTPWVLDGQWVNTPCGCGGSDCSCTTVCEVILPGTVGNVVEVQVDGVTIDPSAYRVDNGNRLVRQDDDCWPICQDMNEPAGQDGTFAVTYVPGYLPDLTVAYAAGVLACEYAKACTGGKCRLPTGVTEITRQGVSMEIGSGAFPGGLTGIREVDTVVAAWNPYGHKTPPVVWSPDVPNGRHTTWVAP